MTASNDRSRPRRPQIRRRRTVARAGAVVYALLTAVVLLTWLAVGDTWWSQPLNLTMFWWLAPAVPLALVAVLARRRRMAAVLAFPALTWVWVYGGLFLPGAAAAEPDLRVLSYNTYVHAPDASHVVALLDAEDPDVVLLQEVFADRWAILDRVLADRYPTRQWFESEGVGGVAVLSRFPMVGEPLPVGEATAASRSTAVVTLDVRGVHVQVVPVHFLSPCPACGTSVLERLELEGEVRRAEASEVLEVLDPSLPAIVAGDLNSTERSDPYRTIVAAGFDDPHRDAGAGPGFTWPNSSRVPPLLRIDWVLTRGFEPVGSHVGAAVASDHLPVVADLAFVTAPSETP